MLTVEDGTGLVDAEALCSVAFADAYHDARGFSLWAPLSTAEKEQAIRRATDAMEQFYREQWAGYRVKTTQALSWPRYTVPIKDSASMNWGGFAYYPSDEVPLIVQQACAALAFKAAAGDLSPDIERVTRRETIGPITTEYAPGSLPFVRYRAIDNMLQPVLSGTAGSLKVVRA